MRTRPLSHPQTPGVRRASCAALALCLAFTVACGGFTPDGESPSDDFDYVWSEKQRMTSVSVPAADTATLIAGNTAFAIDLYQAVRGEPGNLFMSPHSISLALAMAYAGARGDTERQMAAALHFTLPQSRLHAAFNGFDLDLASRGQGARGKDGQPFELHIANSTWGQRGYPFLTPFLDTLALNYGAGLRVLDFASDPDTGRLVINDWVAEKTHDRILDLIRAGAITPLTRMVLVNAIYFNAAWAFPFKTSATQPGDFTRLDGSAVSVQMMHQTEHLRYAGGADYQAVELPYDGDELSMVVIAPAAGQFDAFEAGLDKARLDAIIGGFAVEEVQLTMPRFSGTYPLALGTVLANLGMPIAFDMGRADFSGIESSGELYISDVLHKAFVAVDEKGTEAAAATAVLLSARGVPDPTAQVELDRPFMYLIRDRATGAVLFMGRVLDPSA